MAEQLWVAFANNLGDVSSGSVKMPTGRGRTNYAAIAVPGAAPGHWSIVCKNGVLAFELRNGLGGTGNTTIKDHPVISVVTGSNRDSLLLQTKLEKIGFKVRFTNLPAW